MYPITVLLCPLVSILKCLLEFVRFLLPSVLICVVHFVGRWVSLFQHSVLIACVNRQLNMILHVHIHQTVPGKSRLLYVVVNKTRFLRFFVKKRFLFSLFLLLSPFFSFLSSQVLKAASKENLSDELKWVKFSSIAWTHDHKGFFYQVIRYL